MDNWKKVIGQNVNNEFVAGHNDEPTGSKVVPFFAAFELTTRDFGQRDQPWS